MFSRKPVILLVIAALIGALASGAFAPSPAAAQTEGNMSAARLAVYAPADAVLYVSLRVDDAYVTSLDTLINRIAAGLPAGTIPKNVLRTALSIGLVSTGLDYQTDVRSWLGEYAAMAVGNVGPLMEPDAASRMGMEVPISVIVEVADRAAAEAFLDKVLVEMGNLEKGTNGPFTSYTPSLEVFADKTTVLLGDTVLVIGNAPEFADAAIRADGGLAVAPDFVAALAAMPEPAYNLLAYVAVEQFAAFTGPFGLAETPALQAQMGGAKALMIGAVILDERTLILDYAQYIDKTKVPAWLFDMKPLDTTFLRYVPASSSLVFAQSGVDFSKYVTYILDTAETLYERMGMFGAGAIRAQYKTLVTWFADSFGMDLEKDMLGWMTGNVAAFMGMNPDAPSPMAQLIKGEAFDPTAYDFGVVFEATDPQKAKNAAEKLGAGLEKLLQPWKQWFTVSQETVGGVPATVVAFSYPALANPLEIVIGASDEVFVVATKNAAAHIFSGGPGFDGNPAFADAQTYALDGALQVGYVTPDVMTFVSELAALGLQTAVPGRAPRAVDITEAEKLMGDLQTLAGLFTSAGVFGAYGGESSSVARYTFSLK